MGLNQHIGRQTTRKDVCGIYYKIKERLKRKRLYQKRREAVREEKITNLGPLEHLIFKKKIRGALSTKEKELIVRIFQRHVTKNGYKRSKVSCKM